METFEATKKRFKPIFNDIIKEIKNAEIDEAAFPAYAHKNPLIDYLFWKRLSVAFNFAKKNTNHKRVLDFGCGSGVLSYLLAQNGYNVTSCDIELSPFRLIEKRINFPSDIQFIEGDIITKDLPQNSFDIIFAMDVLEHIENLEDYMKLFKSC
jgi:2-polyprenyl-3-methyl-5-hydroxy-6-metoxy-1,4-benzoquinol methylase